MEMILKMPKSSRGRPSSSVIDRMIDTFDDKEEETNAAAIGNVKHPGARFEWTKSTAESQSEITIEELITDKDNYYLGDCLIWPYIGEEICKIWHMRCDFNVILFCETDGISKRLQNNTIYAMSFEKAEKKARRLWKRHIDSLEQNKIKYWFSVTRDRDLHTVVIEAPKGSGKDFEMSILIVLLTREFLIQDRKEFFSPYVLDLNTTISINCMNRTEDQAKKVTFKEVLPKFNTPFFNDYFPPQIDIKTVLDDSRYYPSELRFPQKIVIFPGTGTASSGLGYTLGSSVIDECNFLQKSDSSKQSIMG